MLLVLDLSAVFITLGHFLDAQALQASVTPLSHFPHSLLFWFSPRLSLNMMWHKLLSSPCTLPTTISSNQQQRCCRPLSSEPQAWTSDGQLHGHPTPSSLCPQAGCPSLPDSSGETGESSGRHPLPYPPGSCLFVTIVGTHALASIIPELWQDLCWSIRLPELPAE